jgi:hypothetical protein
LDGVNHPITPLLTNSPSAQAASQAQLPAENAAASSANGQGGAPSFRFISAVDAPSDEERQRRERERLTVTGRVVDEKGSGVSSALVYLSDEAGHRVGQPCRTAEGTGDFTVRILAPGKYGLHAYKRGLVQADTEPSFLPAESGAIEGIIIRLVPEGCVIKGALAFQDQSDLGPHVRIVAIPDEGERLTADIAGDGTFTLYGAAPNTEYLLRVLSASGELLAESEPVKTERARELYCEIPVPLAQATAPSQSSPADGGFPWPPLPGKEMVASAKDDAAPADAAPHNP